MTIAIIIQARMRSTRLPGKVMKPLPYDSDIPVLSQVIRRAKHTQRADMVVVATTPSPDDNPIAEMAKAERVVVSRGSEERVLERYYGAAQMVNAHTIVRITSDCPCIDPNVIDEAIALHQQNAADYTSNTIERSYPHGLDVEVISFDALKEAYHNASKPFEWEHVTPFIYRSHPERFKIVQLQAPPEITAPDIRITLDTLEDYTLLCAVYDYLYPHDPSFPVASIIRLFNQKPWLKWINQKVVQKKIALSEAEEMKEAARILELQGLHRAARKLKMPGG